MAEEQIRGEVTVLIRRARIRVPDDRLPALEAGLAALRAGNESLSRYEYGLIEPACRFNAPPSSR
ncbi:MAG TPA: hypothetical protein VMT90_07035 [Dehalococcoidia bacterium]|jgi:hypothetical protein|nr:hypothetical protein [Dehalococcoidia bacterium]